MVNSIKKGKNFERDVANFLTAKTGAKFHRVPMSGGFATSFTTKSTEFQGDIFTEDERFKDICIECKAYQSLEFGDIFRSKSNLYSWIDQAIRESGARPWLLIFKLNNRGAFCCYEMGRDENKAIDFARQYLPIDSEIAAILMYNGKYYYIYRAAL